MTKQEQYLKYATEAKSQGSTISEIARKHKVKAHAIYAAVNTAKRRGMWSASTTPSQTPAQETFTAPVNRSSTEIEGMLRNAIMDKLGSKSDTDLLAIYKSIQ